MNLCRLCLTKNEVSHLLYGDNGGESLAPIVSQWFQITPNDVVSTVVCAYCWKNTLNFHIFCSKVFKAQCEHLKDATFVKPLSYIGNVTPLPEYQPKCESTIDLNDCKVELAVENGTDLHNYSDDDYSNPLTTIKTEEELCDSSGKSNPIRSNLVKKLDIPIKQSSNSNDNTSRSKKNERYRKMEDDQIRQFCNMFCDLCTAKQFGNFADANSHYRDCHEIQGYLVCCNLKIGQRDQLIEHIQIHLNPDSDKCKTLDMKLNDRPKLQKCMQTNSAEAKKLFRCDQCPKKYARRSLLTRHKSRGYCNKEDKMYGCDVCQKIFLIKSVLKRHIMRAHVPEVCDYCGKQFKCKYYLNVHRNEAHMGIDVTRLQCHVCGMWVRGSNLSTHVKRHNLKLHPEPRSICSICSKELKNKIVMQRHMKIVHGNREHQCNICGKKFGIPLSLKEHMAVHTGEDLYKCRYCTKTFKSNANMHAHRKKAHFKEWEKDRGKRLIDGRYQ